MRPDLGSRSSKLAGRGSKHRERRLETSHYFMTHHGPQVILDYFDSINSEDWDKLETLWREDAELRVVAARPRFGRDDVLTFYPKALARFPKHRDDPVRISVAGDVVTVEIAFAGTTPEGRQVTFDAVDVFDLRDGKLWKMSSWFNIEEVRRQVAGE